MAKHDKQNKQAEEIIDYDQESYVEELEQKVTELENSYKRALADYQNLEKRVQDERIRWAQMANKDLLSRLLPALDMLMLASKHTKDKGVELTIKHVLEAFKTEGIEKIETQGKDFDPELMEVVETVEGEDGKVVEEVRAGYMLYGQPLRVAQVKVGRKNQE